ncbi:hypothetical protein SCP_0201050 [Sparassis crispa]|uniref:Reverse transcriptase/retrotransposon-derived protein RNase H-like domain-containing protein n=1 Tax=Sparassis crispa TaxID=139825 RepID=A0A401G9R9_9APHY|nr:hypothetical protein SCP_0201050 [Sparassis crispa]GBE78908.1 hypothetical protein SCP_0201050 [Sparassis crispa]
MRAYLHDLFDILPFTDIENIQEVLNLEHRPDSVFSLLTEKDLSALSSLSASPDLPPRSRSISSCSFNSGLQIIITMSSSNIATVAQSSSKHPPVLTSGKITPAVAHAWENTCLQYFKQNDTPADKRVAKVTSGFQDTIVSDWYYNDSDTFDALPWKDFLATFRSRFLPKGWESTILTQLLRSRQKDDEPFEDWVLSLEKMNTILRGSTSHLDDTHLHAQIAASICEDLRFASDDDDVCNIISFKDWKDKLAQMDTICLRERARILHITGASARSKPLGLPIKAMSGKSNTARLPSLTDSELKLLRDNDGCFKCRKFFIDKKLRGKQNCPESFPDPTTYCTLMQADVDKVKRGVGKENIKPHLTVSVVVDGSDDAVYSISAIYLNAPPLAATSGILGTGSDSDNEYVSPALAPFTVPHIPWSTIVHGPSSDSQPLPMLINSGSPAVLIRLELISHLGLRRRKLPQPFPLGDVWGTESKDSAEWVKLRVSLPDSSWSSIVCRAIVVQSCCYPVIVGRPFLKSNHLVVDHSCNMVIDKRSRHDICATLMPPPPTSTPPTPTTLLRISPDPHLFRELSERTAAHHVECDEHTTNTAAATIHTLRKCTEELAYQEKLRAANLEVKQEFVDLFPDDIPHLDDLPTDVYHRFMLKDPHMADPQKVEKILNWSVPHNSSQVRAFLGLVCYIAPFLPKLADHMHILNALTTKEAELNFPQWTLAHQRAFDDIKSLICSHKVLTVIDHDNMGNNHIFVSCDASDFRTGALLSYGKSLETAQPIAFESCTLKGAELNYSIHEKELLPARLVGSSRHVDSKCPKLVVDSPEKPARKEYQYVLKNPPCARTPSPPPADHLEHTPNIENSVEDTYSVPLEPDITSSAPATAILVPASPPNPSLSDSIPDPASASPLSISLSVSPHAPNFPIIPLPIITMSSSTAKGLSGMPAPGSSKVPSFHGESSELLEFFEFFEDLTNDCKLSAPEKCKSLVHYVDKTTKHFWISLASYESQDFETLKKNILAQYPGADKGIRYTLRELEQLVVEQAGSEIQTETELLTYYRLFCPISQWLVHNSHITDCERNSYFWQGLPRDTRRAIDRRLELTIPDFSRAAPPDVEKVVAAGRFVFSDEAFDSEYNDPISMRLRSLKG